MRHLRIALAACAAGCAGSELASPPSPPSALPLISMRIDAPVSIVMGSSQQLKVSMTDASNKVVSRTVNWSTSDPAVATVETGGVLYARAPGFVTISAERDGLVAEARVEIVRPACEPSSWDDCGAAIVYALLHVNGQPLPVRSPWGIGEWDYDSDAGTWMLTDAVLTLFADGHFTYATGHRAASGHTISEVSRGSFTRTVTSIDFEGNGDDRWSADVSGSSLTTRWTNGTLFTFGRKE